MGAKGGTQTVQNTNSTGNTAQSQSYTPVGGSYMTAALDRAGAAAGQPFNIPQAPVAGFSQDQLGAFQAYRNAQGTAQPYYNQAANYFSPQGAQSFMNPYAANVMAGMKDVFGQQATQNTGQLTQAAGGVGADRIGVGQANLAHQQDLAAGQTLAGMYGQAVQQSQQAGQGQMALGQNAQNSAFQGAGQLLGVGGLQQQLQQQQLNAPYQQQVAQAAFPYQQAQFLAGITGALAPAMGGTTQGYGTNQTISNNNGTTTPPPPSIWSQLIGAGTAGAGIYGANGGFSGGTKGSGAGNNYASQPLTGSDAWANQQMFPGYQTAARGGRINPYAEGGEVPEEGGGFGSASMVPGHPIDISKNPLIPSVEMRPAIAPQMPQFNLNPTPPPPPQQPQQQSGGDNTMKMVGDAAKLAMMFVNTGGRVNPYADGGAVDDAQARMRAMAGQNETTRDRTFGTWRGNEIESAATRSANIADDVRGRPRRQYTSDYAEGGGVDDVINPDAPYRMPSAEATERWRQDTPVPGTAMALSDESNTAPAASAVNAYAAGPPRPAGAVAAPAGGSAPAGAAPYSPSGAMARERTFADSPWMALTQAGLGMMAGTSPYAGVNIGAGGQQAMKVLQAQKEAAQKDETIDQSARRLAQEAQHHNDQYTRMTPYQSASLKQAKELAEAEVYAPAGTIQTKDGLHPAFYDKKTAQVIDGITRKPPAATDAVIPKGGSRNSPDEINHVVDGIIDGSSPPSLTGLYGDAVHVRSGLHAKGFNLAKAQQEWESAKKQTAAVNSSRMTAYVGLNRSVDRTIDEVKELANELQQGGVPLLNKLQLQTYIKSQGNSPQGQLATRYMTAVNTLKEEFANLANGGYAPTEAAWKLANEQVNGDFGVKQMHASLSEIQRLIRYRIQAIPNLDTMGPGSTNRYTGATGTTPPPAKTTAPPAAAAAGHGAVDPKGPAAGAVRFQELLKSKSEEEAYKILEEEGYHS